MRGEREQDSEVAADIALRERLARERPGMSEAQFADAIREAATPPKVLDRVPCRARCGNVCEWTEDAQERFEMFNRQLARKMEPPLDKTRIVFCSSCRTKGVALAAENNRKRTDAMAKVIREIKASANPERETASLTKLREWGHPDVDGLLEALRVKRTQPGGKRASKGEM